MLNIRNGYYLVKKESVKKPNGLIMPQDSQNNNRGIVVDGDDTDENGKLVYFGKDFIVVEYEKVEYYVMKYDNFLFTVE